MAKRRCGGKRCRRSRRVDQQQSICEYPVVGATDFRIWIKIVRHYEIIEVKRFKEHLINHFKRFSSSIRVNEMFVVDQM
ncbi:hypothetical protein DICVIV_05545 [Dictyocaulus viviparus]|uniref:Uncharacterized protein n=1 Tax=Dictyocaulus viviparus TaxID=29172 RepID=A0A0D8XX75_DICVI|nr:hypothetical protein DICVIV_05545 [Dictyocaulus viviparus]